MDRTDGNARRMRERSRSRSLSQSRLLHRSVDVNNLSDSGEAVPTSSHLINTISLEGGGEAGAPAYDAASLFNGEHVNSGIEANNVNGGPQERRGVVGGKGRPQKQYVYDLASRLQQAERDLANQSDAWEFAGWGNSSSVSFFDSTDVVTSSGIRGRSRNDDGSGHPEADPETPLLRPGLTEYKPHREEDKLNQYLATSIAGNDITSSCFYMVGIAMYVAGQFAPISVAIVILILYFFRNIYGEVVTALPLNGGTYNALLNVTSKKVASVAAGLTILSYTATAVVSATSAVSYMQAVLDWVPLVWTSVIILGLFALLNYIGLGESANVAFFIFCAHLLTLSVLAGVIIFQQFVYPPLPPVEFHDTYGTGPFSLLMYNWHEHNNRAPDGTNGSISQIFYGFSSALIGVSGFESSANYVEEQRRGVFVKTLRNMWFIVAFFNPLFSLLSIMSLNLDDAGKVQNYILSAMPRSDHFRWMQIWVTIDAFVVLSGAVLTSYVGIVGLARRMALDKCLPQFLLRENKWRKTNHFIIFGFFALTSSLCILTNGSVDVLAGVYTIAFLSVMAMFAFADLLLKYKRRLKSEVRAAWASVLFAMTCVIVGTFGNIIHNVEYLVYFAYYFVGSMALIFLMFTRVSILKMAFFAVSANIREGSRLHRWIKETVKTFRHTPVIFFTKTGQLATLNKAALYVRENEETDWMRIVHVYSAEDDDFAERLEANVSIIDQLYPKMRVDLVLVHGTFNPQTVHWISQMLEVPKNYMFITAPTVGVFPHDLGEFGGIRVVTH